MKKRIKFKAVKLSQNKTYYGTIKQVEIDDEAGRVRIFTELEKIPHEYYMKSVRYSEQKDSPLWTLFDDLGVLDENDEFDEKWLIGLEVAVSLSKGRDGNWYVNEMYRVEEESESPPFDEFDDGIDDIDFDEDEEE